MEIKKQTKYRNIIDRKADVLFNEYGLLKCPVCGFEFNRIKSVRVVRGKQLTTMTHEGINIRDEYECEDFLYCGDYPAIEITFVCERGHEWKLYIAFHEGYSFVVIDDRTLSDQEYRQIKDLYY